MPGALVAALTAVIEHEPLPAKQVVAGSPTTGVLVLDETGGREVGIWEMTLGAATDVEVDEVFVVLAGDASVVFDEVPGGTPPPPVDLAPGAVVRLTAGMRTTWTVRETLRKLYVA